MPTAGSIPVHWSTLPSTHDKVSFPAFHDKRANNWSPNDHSTSDNYSGAYQYNHNNCSADYYHSYNNTGPNDDHYDNNGKTNDPAVNDHTETFYHFPADHYDVHKETYHHFPAYHDDDNSTSPDHPTCDHFGIWRTFHGALKWWRKWRRSKRRRWP
jgi:hypothetical protein